MLSNVVWLFLERALGIISSIFVGAWVARYLGPDQLGQLSYANSLVFPFIAFATLGLDTIVVRNLVRNGGSVEQTLGTTFVLRLVASFVSFALVTTLIWSLKDDALPRLLVLLAAGNVIFYSSFSTIELWFQAQIRSKHVVWVKNVTLLILSVLKIAFVLLEMPLVAFAVVMAFQHLINAFGFVFILRRQGLFMVRWRFHWKLGVAMLRDSWPLIISGIAVSIFLRIDQVMLESMADDTALGVYAVAVRLSEIWYIIPTIVATTVFPAIVRSRERQSEETYQTHIQTFYDLMVLASLLIAVLVTLLADPLVSIFGTQYKDAGSILQLHIWALIFIALDLARSKWLLAENLAHLVMIAHVVSAVINVLLNLVLIPQAGGLGAAWATLISYGVSGYLINALDTRLWPVLKRSTLALLAPFRITSVIRSVREIMLYK